MMVSAGGTTLRMQKATSVSTGASSRPQGGLCSHANQLILMKDSCLLMHSTNDSELSTSHTTATCPNEIIPVEIT